MRRLSGVSDAITSDALVIGGVVVGLYFFVVKPLVSGVTGSDPASQSVIDNELQLSPSINPFSYQYNKLAQMFIAGPYQADGTPFTPQQYFIQLSNLYAQNGISATGNSLVDVTIQGAENIYSALNQIFTVTTDQPLIMSAYTQLTYRVQAAMISAYYFYNYGRDLLSDIQGSLTKNGLSQQNFSTIIQHVNALPDNTFVLPSFNTSQQSSGSFWSDLWTNLGTAL